MISTKIIHMPACWNGKNAANVWEKRLKKVHLNEICFIYKWISFFLWLNFNEFSLLMIYAIFLLIFSLLTFVCNWNLWRSAFSWVLKPRDQHSNIESCQTNIKIMSDIRWRAQYLCHYCNKIFTIINRESHEARQCFRCHAINSPYIEVSDHNLNIWKHFCFNWGWNIHYTYNFRTKLWKVTINDCEKRCSKIST